MNLILKSCLFQLIFLASLGQSYAFCWYKASSTFSLDPNLLLAIAKVESNFNPKAIGFNRTKATNMTNSYDIGLMQINSRHLPRLEKLGITEQRLLQDPCLNLFVGASILAENINEFGYSWLAIGAYNAGSAAKNDKPRKIYAKKVWAAYENISNIKIKPLMQ